MKNNLLRTNFTFRPGVTPSYSRSTIKAVKALPAGAFGSGFVLANRKYLYKRLLYIVNIDII